MSEPYNPRLKSLILQVVDNQLNDNDPPITRITLDRLLASGYSRKRAKEMIGSVVVGFIYDIMKDGTAFDEEKYTAELKALK